MTLPHALPVHQLFEQQAAKTPEAIAIIDKDERVTYQTLNHKANRVANYLARLGVNRNVPVGLCLESSTNLVIGLLGILKAGGGYLPIDLTYPLERIRYMLTHSQSKILITQSQWLEKFADHHLITLCLDSEWQTIENAPSSNTHPNVKPEDLAYIIYTSGSTGHPKGIEMPHNTLVNLIQWQIEVTTIPATAKTLQFTPISFDVSFQEMLSTLCSGGTLVAMPAMARKDPEILLHFLIEQKIERIFMPPVALHQLAMVAIDLEKMPSSLKEVITAGDQLQITPTVTDFFNNLDDCTLHNHYGPSETHVVTAFTLKDSPSTWPKLPPIGQAIHGCQIYLLDEEFQQVPVGNCGEIHIGGVTLARGYLNNLELTQSRFIPNPYGTGRLYKSGDLARQLPDGDFEFLGRSDHQVKIRGFRIELGEVETILLLYPTIKEAVVTPYEDTTQNKRLVAYLVAKSASELKEASGIQSEQVQTWQRIWDEAYRAPGKQSSDHFHLGGWNDSYTGAALPEPQVREWVSHTVKQILTLSPKRILEIGCGTGLLLFPIAPQCSHYYGTDISAEGIQYIQQQIDNTPLAETVTLQQLSADALSELAIEPVDTVVINGVIQFFPGIDYFMEVLEKTIPLVQPGGQIFIGDVQSYSLMELFHTSVQLFQSPIKLSVADLRQRIKDRMAEEKKLLFAPDFFATLPQRLPQVSHVTLQLKRGEYQNELTRFRYDVILHIHKQIIPPKEPWYWDAWQAEKHDWNTIRQKLAEQKPEWLGIAQVPNARLWYDGEAIRQLAQSHTAETIGNLKNRLQPGGIEPERWWDLESEFPYRVSIVWSGENNLASYDVLLQRSDSKVTITAELFPSLASMASKEKSWSAYTNDPLQSKEALIPKIHHFLKQKLPDYMIPTSFIFLDKLPLTASGKINRQLLPAPKSERPILEQPFVAPLTATEEKLAEIFTEVLNIRPVGRHDNFFDLGGHSLLIMQLLSQIRKSFQVDLPLTYLFENPTLAQLSRAIKTHRESDQPEAITLHAIPVKDLQDYVQLDATIGWNHPGEASNTPKRVLLTGVTGFIGAFMLETLLQQTEAEVYCLVRGCKTITKARQRLYNHLRHYHLTRFVHDETLNPRIIPILGDLSQPLLGLTREDFDLLAHEIDIIYHLGAEVNLLYPYQAIQATNVQGTQEVLRLASHIKLKSVHYTSTMGIFESSGYVDNPLIPEQITLKGGDLIYGGYAQSKWVSEQLLGVAQSRGIPVTIYRPGAITGHSQTGVSDTDHILIVLLRYFLQQRTVPQLEMLFDMTPVDYVCQAMIHLSQQTDSWGKVFHLVNPQSFSFTQLADLLTTLGYPVSLMDYPTWLATLREIESDSPENLFGAILPVLTGKMQGTPLTYLEMSSIGMKFDCRQTHQGLTSSSIRCPAPDLGLLKIYLEHLESGG